MSKSEKVTISEEASNLIALYGSSCWHQQVDEKRADRAKLESYIATLEAEIESLRPYRDGYDPKKHLPPVKKAVLIHGKSEKNPNYKGFDVAWIYGGEWISWNVTNPDRWYPLPPAGKEGE